MTSDCCIIAKGKLRPSDYIRALFVTFKCGTCNEPLNVLGMEDEE